MKKDTWYSENFRGQIRSIFEDSEKSFHFTKNILDDIFSIHKGVKLGCIVDAGGVLRDYKAIEFSNVLLKKLPDYKIIYFDEEDQRKELGVGNNKTIVFFDQRHSRGTDITMDIHTNGLILLDSHRTTYTDACQASYRMGQINHGQTAYFLYEETNNSESVLDILDKNEEAQNFAKYN